MKNPPQTATHVVLIAVPAYSERMAERIKQQAEHFFAEREVETVEIDRTPPPAPVAAAAPAAEIPPAPEAVAPASEIIPAKKIDLEITMPETAAEFVPPFFVGQSLRDQHVPDRVVNVNAVSPSGFTVSDSEAEISWQSASSFEPAEKPQTAAATESKTKPAKKPDMPKTKTKHVEGSIPSRSSRRQKPRMIGANKSHKLS